jgi:outer membrane protein TolC
MKNLEIAKEKVNQTIVSYETAQNKLKAGLIAEVEALQLEVDLATSKNDLLTAERNNTESQNNFKFLIGLMPSENISIKDEIDFNPIDIDENTAVEYALKNRAELFTADADIKLGEMALSETDSKKAIHAELNASYGINKNANEANAIFRDFADNRSVSVTLYIPVWDWGKNRCEVQAAAADLKQNKIYYSNQHDYIEKEVRQLVNKIRSARARVEVLAKSVDVALKSYNISTERFKAGNITSFDLSQVQNRLTDVKTNSLNALIEYKLSITDLNRKTLFDFNKK